jgi:Kef-type K+ transport system membrane component KefB
MIVAQMGLSLGALSTAAYSAVVLMAAATTLLAPPLLNVAFRNVQPVKETEEVLRLG